MTKHLIIFSTAVMTTLLALVALWQFRIVVVYFLISLALAATARPFVQHWYRQRLAVRLSLVFVYLAGLVGLSFLIFLGGEYVFNDVQKLAQTLSVQDAWRLPPWLQDNSTQRSIILWLPPPSKLIESITGTQGQLVLPTLISFTQGIAGLASGVIVILFLSIYWSGNQIHFERLWLSLLPSDLRKTARDIWRTIEPDLGAYIRSEVTQSFLAVLLLGFGYWSLGSQYPALLALIGALAWLIPVVGVAIAIILPLLIGLLTSVPFSLLTVLYTLVVLITLQLWIEPHLFRRKWDNPILTLVILLAMADTFGLLGIIVAPPLSAICQILWNHLVLNRLASAATIQVSDLKVRQEQLLAAIEEMDGPPPPLVISSMERLTILLEKTSPILQEDFPTELSPPNFFGNESISPK